jgi:hypothetical protein
MTKLTLIVLGKVKLDLANFDVKFLTKILIYQNLKKIPVPAKKGFQIFFNF